MPSVRRPDGAEIFYEVEGDGFPLLLFAPGGMSSENRIWREVSALNPFDMSDEFMVIGMNQRHTEGSPAPLALTNWAIHAADQRAVLDDLGIDRALIWGGCIGVGFCLRFIMESPDRVAGSVCQDPVGLVDGYNDLSNFKVMFAPTIALAKEQGMAAVVAAAMEESLFIRNHPAGPFAPTVASNESFREEMLALDPEVYVQLMHGWDDQMWGAEGAFMSVPESFIPQMDTPMLVLPGSDEFHPTATAERICREAPNARCLDVDCRDEQNLSDAALKVREFLREAAAS